MIKNNVLQSASDINYAFLYKLHIEVWRDGEIVDYGGSIQKHLKYDVMINGMHYMKHAFEFRIKK